MSEKKKKSGYHHGDLRAGLLRVAVDVLAEKGLAGLSLRECARRLGVSHAAPYRHFKTRDELLEAVSEQGFEWLIAAADDAMAALETPRARLDAYGLAYVSFASRHPQHHRVMFAAELPKRDAPGAAGRAFELLRECASAENPTADPELAAFAYWSLVHGVSMLILDGRVPEEHLAGDGAVEALTEQVFQLWRGGDAG